MKRVLAIFLCVLMLAALFPVSALATEGNPCLEGYDEHDYVPTVTAATCTTAGYTTYTCSRCSDSYTVDGDPALGHSIGEGVVTAPTCTAAGYTTYSCTRDGCNYSCTEEGDPALGHSLGEGVVTAPTCTAAGCTTYSCTRDGCNYSCTADGDPALGHDYECVVTREPTDEEDGLKTYTCTRCGDSYTEPFTNQPAVRLATALQSNRGLKNISNATVTGIPEEVTYTGSQIKPVPTSVTMDDGATTLVQGTDFTLAYGTNVNAGNATVSLIGSGDYEGTSKTVNFQITPAPLTIKANDQTYVFDNSPHGESDPAYTDATVIAKKVTVTGLKSGDKLSSIIMNGQRTAIGVYLNEIKVTGFTIDDDDENTSSETSKNNYDVERVSGTLTIADPETTYNIKVEPNTAGWGSPTASPTSGKYGQEVTLTPNAGTNYLFKEWQVTKGDVDIEDNKFTIGTSDVEIIAVYEAKPQTTVTVTFDANGHGTAPATQTIDKGGKATKPTDLTAKGWIFDGWYTTKAGTTEFDFNAAVNANTTVYAKWTEIVYTVTKGEFTRWWKGGIEGVSITVKRTPNDKVCYDHFSGVAIDDTVLSKSAYTAKKGSTVVYLKPETLNKLHRGYHDVTILFDDGSAYAEVKIYTGAPKTGDSNDNIGNWLALLLVSGFAFGGLATVALKKPRKSGKR